MYFIQEGTLLHAIKWMQKSICVCRVSDLVSSNLNLKSYKVHVFDRHRIDLCTFFLSDMIQNVKTTNFRGSSSFYLIFALLFLNNPKKKKFELRALCTYKCHTIRSTLLIQTQKERFNCKLMLVKMICKKILCCKWERSLDRKTQTMITTMIVIEQIKDNSVISTHTLTTTTETVV